jgi:phosphoribosylformylglycinamidine cyclo-ligase
VRNLIRLHGRVRFVLGAWPEVPDLFEWIASLGPVSDHEMFQTLNMGIGFIVVARPGAVPAVRHALARSGAPDAVELGHVERGSGVDLPGRGLRYEGYGSTARGPKR